MTMTTNLNQSETVSAFGVFTKVIIATAQERASLHAAGIHVCIEMLTDGLSVSYRVPVPDKLQKWELLKQVITKIQDILWNEGDFTCKYQPKRGCDTRTYICGGSWDIQWTELNEVGVMTFDNGGQ